MLGWLKSLPDALVSTRPNLCTIQAFMLVVTHQLGLAEARLQDAERGMQVDMSVEQVQTIQGQVAVSRAYIARYLGDFVASVALSNQALALLPETETRWWRRATMTFVAQAYLVSGDVTPERERQVAVALVPARTSGNLCLLLRSLTLQAQVQGMQGRLHQAASTYEQVVQLIGGQEVLPLLFNGPSYYFGLGDLLREWNDLDAAQLYLSEGMRLIEGMMSVDADVVMRGYTALARLQQARGDYCKALATLDAFMQMAHQRHFVPWLVSCVLAVRAQVELARGNVAAASQWAEQCGLSLEEDQPSYLHEQEYLTLVRVCIAQERESPIRQDSSHTQPVLVQVLGLLERLCEQAESKARISSVIELLILQALALQVQGKRANALKALERALVFAEPEGYMRLFLDEGAPLVDLLRRASAHGIAASYLQRLLAAFGEQAEADDYQQATPSESLLEPFTAREREVLNLLMRGASNRQMAQDLVLSVGTIKKYVYTICGKLGVENRTQAVIKATALNLL